ncbi:hypothetical protein JQ609_04305 [Bradyrhizobium sp. AUGA SZCCT0169]|uniref:hypothetical protein n=1 Tax=Bradyrhizobium sp. AUGA SZCCT0169 TaxID=2807663 RepID=UPI001BAD3AEC|nr:hypothetical protein [Bradyrhizobium sp. AUGA SZCCT0169]MBR1246151.1 hypothetical protein [Bradyrhizobium sp. AUGA SZCCT0169]
MTAQPELKIAIPLTKREAIETELRHDADRSDREIARIVGCDHKTVAARRREMGISPTLGNSPAIPSEREFRDMLVRGAKDFDAKFPPASAEERVDRMISDGVINYASAGSGGSGEKDAAPEDEGVTVLCPRQLEITVHFNEDADAVLRQANWPDDDDTIIIRRDNVPDFIDRLTDALGIPSIGRSG